MEYTLYVNEVRESARLHYDDCNHLRKHKKGGSRGYYRYFDDYNKAWEWIADNLENYDSQDCSFCEPEL